MCASIHGNINSQEHSACANIYYYYFLLYVAVPPPNPGRYYSLLLWAHTYEILVTGRILSCIASACRSTVHTLYRYPLVYCERMQKHRSYIICICWPVGCCSSAMTTGHSYEQPTIDSITLVRLFPSNPYISRDVIRNFEDTPSYFRLSRLPRGTVHIHSLTLHPSWKLSKSVFSTVYSGVPGYQYSGVPGYPYSGVYPSTNTLGYSEVYPGTNTLWYSGVPGYKPGCFGNTRVRTRVCTPRLNTLLNTRHPCKTTFRAAAYTHSLTRYPFR